MFKFYQTEETSLLSRKLLDNILILSIQSKYRQYEWILAPFDVVQYAAAASSYFILEEPSRGGGGILHH